MPSPMEAGTGRARGRGGAPGRAVLGQVRRTGTGQGRDVGDGGRPAGQGSAGSGVQDVAVDVEPSPGPSLEPGHLVEDAGALPLPVGGAVLHGSGGRRAGP